MARGIISYFDFFVNIKKSHSYEWLRYELVENLENEKISNRYLLKSSITIYTFDIFTKVFICRRCRY